MINLCLKYIGAFICVSILIQGIFIYRREPDRIDGRHLRWFGLFAFLGAVIALGGEGYVQTGMRPMVHVAYNATLNALILGMVYHGVGMTVAITGERRGRMGRCKLLFVMAFFALVVVDALFRIVGEGLLPKVTLLVGIISNFHSQERTIDRRLAEYWIKRFSFASQLSPRETEDLIKASYLSEVARIPMPGKRIQTASDGQSASASSQPADDEAEVVDRSADFAAEMLGWGRVATIIRHSRERWDGTGYPDGLEGEEIPLLSRVLAIAEVFVAELYFTEDVHAAIEPVKKTAGTRLDPNLTATLEQMIQ